MLGLLKPTDPAWVEAVERDLEGLPADHALAGRAERIFGAREARARLGTLAAREASIADGLPPGATVHG